MSDTDSARTRYALDDGIATITMDDGKVNALSESMLREIASQFDRAESEEAEVVVFTGREQTFSAGFDLRTEAEGWPDMLVAGAELAEQLLSFPRPVVAACNGNALAMAAFLLLSADVRVGVAGEHKLGLNEARIGLTVPWFGIEIARHRLNRPYFDRCLGTGVILDPEEAREAGFLDRVVEADVLDDVALEVARDLKGVKSEAHRATKLRIRKAPLDGIRDGIDRIRSNGEREM
jgi:enoyl-CoA hydratase